MKRASWTNIGLSTWELTYCFRQLRKKPAEWPTAYNKQRTLAGAHVPLSRDLLPFHPCQFRDLDECTAKSTLESERRVFGTAPPTDQPDLETTEVTVAGMVSDSGMLSVCASVQHSGFGFGSAWLVNPMADTSRSWWTAPVAGAVQGNTDVRSDAFDFPRPQTCVTSLATGT